MPFLICYILNSSSKTEDTASDSVEAAKNASDKKGKKYVVVGNIRWNKPIALCIEGSFSTVSKPL